eukprot:scaffold57222_cov51-Phaeocystis_antarctica.AAC.2
MGEQLLEVTRPHHPHLHRGVWLHQVEQHEVADPPPRRQLLRVSRRVVAHDVLDELVLEGAGVGGGNRMGRRHW